MHHSPGVHKVRMHPPHDPAMFAPMIYSLTTSGKHFRLFFGGKMREVDSDRKGSKIFENCVCIENAIEARAKRGDKRGRVSLYMWSGLSGKKVAKHCVCISNANMASMAWTINRHDCAAPLKRLFWQSVVSWLCFRRRDSVASKARWEATLFCAQ